jgi:hypothetical protein
MAVKPKEMMEMLKGDLGMAAEETPPPALQDEMTPPMASPMSTPEEKRGEQEKARLNVMMALDMLQAAFGAFDAESPEGKTIEKVIGEIARRFGERESETRQLIPTEILQMIQTLPQAGGATPGQRTAALAPVPGASTPPLPL